MSETTLTVDRLRGSLPRCLQLTYFLPSIKTVELLTELAKPSGAIISSTDCWMPQGLMDWKEATLIHQDNFLNPEQRKIMTEWWLAKPGYANPPNWDIASRCFMEGRKGLLLIEAKAHDKELYKDGKHADNSVNSQLNHERIGHAIEEAKIGLNKISKEKWAISRDKYYQLSNRFAWSWKLASLGIPVVLIYLGFINAAEMSDRGEPFENAKIWERCIRGHSQGIVPDNTWNSKLDINGTPLWVFIRSMEMTFNIL